MKKIISNKIRCTKCNDVIESFYTHDFKWCSCGQVAVDGGHEYCRITYTNSRDDFEDLCVTEEEDDSDL